MPRSGNQAIDWARAHTRWPVGYCQQYVRTAFDVGAYYGTASQAWAGATKKHRVSHGAHCPRGVPVFWTGGSHGYGHVALSIGNGLCISTDAGGAGVVAVVSIDSLTARWGLSFQGWTEDINTVTVFHKPKPRKRLGKIRFAISLDNVKVGRAHWQVRRLQRALKRHGYVQKVTGFYGDQTRKNVRAFQHKLGYRGADADGHLGRTSARRLGLKPR